MTNDIESIKYNLQNQITYLNRVNLGNIELQKLETEQTYFLNPNYPLIDFILDDLIKKTNLLISQLD